MSNIVSVIIVSWNITRFLENSLASILANPTASQDESRVVDNPSADDCLRIVREKFPQVHPIEKLENVAFVRANKPIPLQCTRKYIPLLNPDTLAAPGARHSPVDILNKQPKSGDMGVRIFNSNSSPKIASHSQPTPTRRFWRLLQLGEPLPSAAYAGTLRDNRSLFSSSEALYIGESFLAFNPGTS